MKHVILPDRLSVLDPEDASGKSGRLRRLVFYLSMEEYLTRFEEDAFFIWQSDPTVICGRNQIAEAEINLRYCREHGISWYRRKSGGGCVYSDRGNLMLSYITATENAADAFSQFLDKLVEVLRGLGVPAERSGRNDVLVGGKKVSGNSFYAVPGTGRSIVHGTLLYDTDFENMTCSITPSEQKLSGHAVESVRQRIALLKDWLPTSTAAGATVGAAVGAAAGTASLTAAGGGADCKGKVMGVEELKAYLVDAFCDSERILDESEVAEIEEIEKGYLEDGFRLGRSPEFSVSREASIPGAGLLKVGLKVRKGLIESINLSGDYFELRPGLEEMLSGCLAGCLYERKAMAEKLAGLDVATYIYKLELPALLDLLKD